MASDLQSGSLNEFAALLKRWSASVASVTSVWKHDLEVGDVVQLRSGGASMTITEDRPTDVTCAWLDSEGRLHERQFDYRCLSVVSDDGAGEA